MRLSWDQVGQKKYETGASKCVLYPASNGIYPLGVAWNGFTGFTESPSGAEAKPMYANNGTYVNLISTEKFAGTIKAFMYPDEFKALNGSAQIAPGVHIGQQKRSLFGLSYQTIIGNDIDNEEYGYKIHLVYGAQASPSEIEHATIGENTEPSDMSWPVSTTPVAVEGFKPTATLEIDSTTTDPAKLKALEDILYGTDGADPRLPLPDEVAAIVGGAAPSELTVSSVPANAATAVAVGSSVVLTFNNKIAKESVLIMVSASGAPVPCTKTVDATGKILTFKPTSNLSAATKYLVAITGVVDIYNQTLAATVNTFTTA